MRSIYFVVRILRAAMAVTLLAGLGPSLKAEPQESLGGLVSSSTPIEPGDTFSLDVLVSDTAGSDQLDAYDVQLSGTPPTDPSSPTPLPSGIELTGFTDPFGATNPDYPTPSLSSLSFSNAFQDPSDDVTIGSSPVALVTADFTALSPGDYTIYFAPVNSGLQDLSVYDPNTGDDDPLNFTEMGTEVDVLPEPSTRELLGAGFLLVIGWQWSRRWKT